MLIKLDKDGTLSGLQHMLAETEADANTTGIMILACDANDFTTEGVDALLKRCKKPVFGGIFPQILFNEEILEKGTIVSGLGRPVSTAVIRNISNAVDLDTAVEQSFALSRFEDKTIFTFVDGLSRNISGLIDGMLNTWGLLPNYVGGGAGSLTFVKKPCIFTNMGLLQDAVVFALIESRSGIGVAHGWEVVEGPLKVTGADHNAIISLNLRPAFDVYAEVVEKVSGKSFEDTDFFELAKEFPFGIAKMSDEVIVRDPILREGDSIVCVGEIPRDSFVYILKGNKDSLVAGATKARQLAETTYTNAVPEAENNYPVTFFADCISRVLFLGPDFSEELEAVYAGHQLLGALTIGEIANTGKGYLEFYNKTSVVALLED